MLPNYAKRGDTMTTPARSVALAAAIAGGLGLLASASVAQSSLPAAVGRVNDFAKVLDTASQARISAAIDALERETGVEMAVVTVQRVHGRTPKQYATALFNHWGIGKRDENNGLLLLLALEQRRVELEAGIGLERVFPEARATALLDETAVPSFRQGQYGRGLAAAVERCAAIVRAEAGAPATRTAASVPQGAEAPDAAALSVEREAPPAASLPAEAEASRPRRAPGNDLDDETTFRPSQGLHFDLPHPVALIAVLHLLVAGGLVLLPLRRPLAERAFLGAAALGLLVPVLVGWLATEAFAGQFWVWDLLQTLVAPVGGLMVLGGIVAVIVQSHRCPKCRGWTRSSRRTLHAPTYTEAGLAEKTQSCGSCGYHKVTRVTLGRKTRSTGSSSSRSSSSRSSSSRSSSSRSSRSSFGGGRSRGGGGGSSW
jgi:uncharacterized protein